MISGSPGSTPSASAGSPSVTRLIHRSWSGSSAAPGEKSAVTKTTSTSDMLQASRNRMTLRRLSKTLRPCSTACDDRREVVVREHHVGRLAGHIRADLSHGDADIGALERRRVVDAVAGHRDDLATGLERVDDAQLVLGIDASVDADVADLLGELGVGHRFELGAVDHAIGVEQADVGGDGACRQRVVAGHHGDVDAGAVALGDGGADFLARRIDHAENPDVRQVALHLRRRLLRRVVLGPEVTQRERQRAVPAGGELGVRRLDCVAAAPDRVSTTSPRMRACVHRASTTSDPPLA